MFMEAREEPKDNLAPMWSASHGLRILARLLSSRERGSLEAVCQSQRLSSRAFGPL